MALADARGSSGVRFAPEASNQEWHWVRSWRIFSSLPLSPLSSKPLGKSCWRPGKEPIGGTDRPEDLSEQSFDCDPPDRQSETSLADLDARLRPNETSCLAVGC